MSVTTDLGFDNFFLFIIMNKNANFFFVIFRKDIKTKKTKNMDYISVLWRPWGNCKSNFIFHINPLLQYKNLH
jgi:hypothetical protein